jgi:hypothetical protein
MVMPSAPGPTCAPMIADTGTRIAERALGKRLRSWLTNSGARSSGPKCSTAMSTARPSASATARSTILRTARSVPIVLSSGATSPLRTVSSGLSDNALPTMCAAAPIRPLRRRYSRLSTWISSVLRAIRTPAVATTCRGWPPAAATCAAANTA